MKTPNLKFMKKLIVLSFFCSGLCLQTGTAQTDYTILINPKTEGGFNPNTNWQIVNGTATNGWYKTTPSGGANPLFTGNYAFISGDGGVSNTYDNTSSGYTHMYIEVAIPANQPDIRLAFDWISYGEELFDGLQVSYEPTSTTAPTADDTPDPTAQTGAIVTGTGVVLLTPGTSGFLNINPIEPATYKRTFSAKLPSSLSPVSGSTNIRLIFTWRNDNGGSGTQSPIALDNVSLTSASYDYGRTLNVDYFGQSIFNVNEIGGTSTTYERQDDLIKYIEDHNITTIILKRLDQVLYSAGSVDIPLFPEIGPSVTFPRTGTGSTNAIAQDLVLADFLVKCRLHGVKRIGAGNTPFYTKSKTLGVSSTATTCGTITSSGVDKPLRFTTTLTTTNEIKIASVKILPTASGVFTVELRDFPFTTTLYSKSFTVVNGVAQTLNLDWVISATGNYQLTNTTLGASSINSGLTCNYPFNSPAGLFSITGSASSSSASAVTNAYNTFFNVVVQESDAINYFFRSIVNFNTYYSGLSGYTNAYFDILYGEFDYWGGQLITSNDGKLIVEQWNRYSAGLAQMFSYKGTHSPGPGGTTAPLSVATYIGDFDRLPKACSLVPITVITEQTQATTIDDNVDFVYVEFYFDGKKLESTNSLYAKQYFSTDASRGRRLELFSMNNKSTTIIPLFGSSAASSAGDNYFGENLKYNYDYAMGDPLQYWIGTIQDVESKFMEHYSNTSPIYNDNDPYDDASTSLSMMDYTETGTYPNTIGGFSWFKYSTMPDARIYLKSDRNIAANNHDEYGVCNTFNYTIGSDELINTGSGTTVCTGGSGCVSLEHETGLTFTVSNYKWYVNKVPISNTSTSIPFTAIDGIVNNVTCEMEVNSPSSNGIFNNIKLRKNFTVDLTCPVGPTSDHFVVLNYKNPTCPSFDNGTAQIYYESTTMGSNTLFLHYFLGGVDQGYADEAGDWIITGLVDGVYEVKLYAYSTYTNISFPFTLFRNDNTPAPVILTTSEDGLNCHPVLVTGNYDSYQWKFNGTTNISSTYGGNTQSVDLTSAPYGNGNYTVTVTTGSCSGTSDAYILNLNPTSTLNGSNITCEDNKTYTVTTDTNDPTYVWTVPSGATYTQDVNQITVSWGTAATTGGTISCIVTNACWQSTTANIIVKGCCTTASIWDMNNYSITSGTPSLTGTFNINGTLNISGGGTVVTMNGVDVKLSKEAKIVVGAGAKLIISGSSYLRSCGTDMWTGIELQGNAIVELNSKSKIEDAEIAINALSNGTIRVDDATLNANYKHIRIHSNGATNSSYIRNGAILSCGNSLYPYFNCLKAPHTSERTFHGIELINVGNITIGASSGARNNISYSENGVYSYNSTPTVSYTDFNLNQVGCYAEVSGSFLAVHNGYNNCEYGIQSKYDTYMEVSDNSFEGTNYGVHISESNRTEFHIHNNSFHNSNAFAIQHLANNECVHEIYSNYILNESDSYAHGIEVIGLTPEQGGSINSPVLIYSNELYNTAFGIHVQSMDEAQIYNNLHNEVMHTPEPEYTTYGILIEYCNKTLIQNNSVSSYGSSLQNTWWSNGIMADNSPETQMLCNSVGNIGRGLWIGGESPSTVVAGNSMGNCYDQLYLNWNLMGLQDQGGDASMYPSIGLAYDNEWVGTVNSTDGHQTKSYYSNMLEPGGYTKFYTRAGGVYEPTDNAVYPTASVYDVCYAISLGNEYDEVGRYCEERPELPEEREVEERIARGEYEYNSNFATFEWMSKEYLLNKAKKDPSLAANSTDIATAVAQLEQSNVGIISAIKDSISGLELDSVNLTDIQQLLQLNSGVQPLLAIEGNYKIANNLSLNYAKNKNFTYGQKSTVVYLSNLCPYAAGPAVYMARTLRALYDTIPHHYTNACQNYNPIPAFRKANNSLIKTLETRLFPSPSDGNAVYEFAIDEKATVSLKVFDYTGKMILSKDVSGTNKYELKKLNLSEGVYRVQLFVNGELGDEQNMVVVK